jgi:uncharacterized protein (DUF58 family)
MSLFHMTRFSFWRVAGAAIRLRTRAPLWALPILLLAAVFLPSPIWSGLLIGWGGFLLLAYLWARGLAKGLHGRRQLRFGWAAVGDRLSEQFDLQNDSPWPALWVELIDDSNVPGYQASVVHSLSAGQAAHWRYAAVCQRRGQFRLGPWRLRTADPLGLFEVRRDYADAAEIIIHPPTQTDIPIPLPAGTSPGPARARERSWQATINAATVREYQPHDPLRWVHWPTTARRGELFTRQFDLDAAGEIWLLLDMETAVQLGAGSDGTEEQSVLLAAALAARGLAQNRAVGLAAYGRDPQIIPPALGAGQQWRLLRALALLQADGATSLTAALRDVRQAVNRGATAVIVTPNASPDWLPELLPLAQKGVRLNLILLERRSFGDPSANSYGLQTAARQLGFDCRLLRQGELRPPEPDADQRRGFWEFRTLATGKVITVKSPGN